MCKTSSELKKQIEDLIEDHKERIEYLNEVTTLIIEYINLKITPYSLSDTGESGVKNLIDKFPVHQLLDGIDEAFTKNVNFDKNGIIKESVEIFLDKMPNFIAVMGMTPVRKKILYIRGIARNRFTYWDDEKGTILLEDYVKALEDNGWSVQQILKDLENEMQVRTKRAKNWSEWKNLIEGWTNDINHWEKAKKTDENIPTVIENSYPQLTEEEIDNFAEHNINSMIDKINVLLYLCKANPNFDMETYKNELKEFVISFINKQQKDYRDHSKSIISYDKEYINSFLEGSSIFSYLWRKMPKEVGDDNVLPSSSLMFISYIYSQYILSNILSSIYYTEEFNGNDCDALLKVSKKHFEEMVW